MFKLDAYRADSKITTHPIQGDVPDAGYAAGLFDAITYNKGVAALRQLSFFVGEDRFREAARSYLKAHKYGNTTLGDFLEALEKASGKNLETWANQWLREGGHNRIAAECNCENGKIESFFLNQSPGPFSPTLRDHRVQVALFNTDGKNGKGGIRLDRTLPVTVAGSKTELPELKGKPCPEMIVPNYGDWGFVDMELDRKSIATLKANLPKIREPLNRI
jgi:aminopeptidase N